MENKTPNGKTIDIVREPRSGFLKLQFKEGGELPMELQGTFTTYMLAKKAIDVYLESKQPKTKKE